jgi:hypothetical protein
MPLDIVLFKYSQVGLLCEYLPFLPLSNRYFVFMQPHKNMEKMKQT